MNYFENKLDAGEHSIMGTFKPDHVFRFFDVDQKEIGRLDFNGPTVKFEGNAEESAKLFFDLLVQYLQKRLEEEREAGRREARQQNTA
jgi:hypothetical protein